MLIKFLKRNWIVFLIFGLSFGLYYYSAGRTNLGYGDSDEIITVSYLLGSAHPPGYPLQIMLTKAFASLPLGGSYAFRANILAGLLHSLVLVLLFLLVRDVEEFIRNEEGVEKEENNISNLGIAFGVFVLGLSALFWLYSSVLEVFALNDFLTILTAWTGFKWYREFRFNHENECEKLAKENFYLIISCVLLGIGLSHVQTFVMLFPGFLGLYIYALTKFKKWKDKWVITILGMSLVILAFFGVNLNLFWLNGRQADVSWWFEQNLSGWWFHVRRGAYAKKFVVGSKEMTSDSFWKAYWGGINLKKYANAIPRYFGFISEHFTFVGLGLGILGIYYLFTKSKSLWFYFVGLFAFSGVVLAMLMGVPKCDSQSNSTCLLEIGISHRQYLQGEVLWSIFICLGAVYLFRLIYLKMKNLENALFVMVLIMSLSLGISMVSHWNMGVNRNNSFANDFARAVLKDLPENAVLISSGDLPSMALFYAQEVEGYRTDVKLFPRNRLIKKYYLLKNPDYYGYFFDNATEHMIDLIGFNVNKGRDVFLVDFSDEDAPFLGLGDSTYFTIPYSYVFKIVDEIPSEIPTFNYELTEKLLKTKGSDKNYLKAVFSEYVIFNHINYAKLYSAMGMEEDAIKHAKYALAFRDHEIAKQVLKDPLAYYNERYEAGGKVYTGEDYFEKVKKALLAGNSKQAYTDFYKGLLLDPTHVGLRRLLADFYIRIGNPERAQIYYEYLEKNQGRL